MTGRHSWARQQLDKRPEVKCSTERGSDGQRLCPRCDPKVYADRAAKHRSDRP